MSRFIRRKNSQRATVAQQGVAPSRLQSKTFPAPIAGWVTADSLISSRPNAAQVLDNFFPLQGSVRMRGGLRKWGQYDGPIVSMMHYNVLNGQKLFVATANAVYDNSIGFDLALQDEDGIDLQDEDGGVLAVNDDGPVKVIGSLTAGYWSYVNFATEGGYFLLAVNGADPLQLFDGAMWYPITATPLLSIGFEAETGAFTVGETLTGANSSATGEIVKIIKAADADDFGTLWVNKVSGDFDANETITDSAAGSATTTGTATPLFNGITGDVETDTFSHVSAYRNRLFFVRGDTMEIYYLPVGSITGALGLINLSGIFLRGGAVLATATWSMDAGDGLDDKFVVISTEGEIAVFQGSNPGDASDWGLVGRYDMTAPMGKRAMMRAGGDLMIATVEGLVPISQAVAKDSAGLSLAAVSVNIEPDWLDAAVDRRSLPWEIMKWSRKNMMLVSLPASSENEIDHFCFVCNLETGAWARFTGWDTRCTEIFNDWGYIGTGDGRVLQIDIGGDDDGKPYYPTYVGTWDTLGALGVQKTVRQSRATFVTGSDVNPQITVSTNYHVTLPPPPSAPISTSTPSLWDVGRWDRAVFDAGSERYTQIVGWSSIGRSGYAIAPQMQLASSGDIQPTAELVEITYTFETSGPSPALGMVV